MLISFTPRAIGLSMRSRATDDLFAHVIAGRIERRAPFCAPFAVWLMETGRYGTIDELAAAEKINSSYVSRLLRLTLLSPDIVEAILDGRQSEGMTLPGLMEPFPAKWSDQKGDFLCGRSPEAGTMAASWATQALSWRKTSVLAVRGGHQHPEPQDVGHLAQRQHAAIGQEGSAVEGGDDELASDW
jgi:hypothetical protein